MKTFVALILLSSFALANEKPKTQPYWQKMGRTEIYRSYERPCKLKNQFIGGNSRQYNPRTVRINVPYRSQLPKYILKKK